MDSIDIKYLWIALTVVAFVCIAVIAFLDARDRKTGRYSNDLADAYDDAQKRSEAKAAEAEVQAQQYAKRAEAIRARIEQRRIERERNQGL